MDKTDKDWFNEFGRISCPNLTPIEFETIVDNLENASTRTLIALDEARTLLPTIDDLHMKTVYEYWNERRTTRVYSFSFIVSLLGFFGSSNGKLGASLMYPISSKSDILRISFKSNDSSSSRRLGYFFFFLSFYRN